MYNHLFENYQVGKFVQCIKCECYAYKKLNDLISFFRFEKKYSKTTHRNTYNCKVFLNGKTYIFHPTTGKKESIDYCNISNNDFFVKSIIE